MFVKMLDMKYQKFTDKTNNTGWQLHKESQNLYVINLWHLSLPDPNETKQVL